VHDAAATRGQYLALSKGDDLVFLRFSSFIVLVIVISLFLVFLSQAFFLSNKRLFVDFGGFTFSVPFKTFSVIFQLGISFIVSYRKKNLTTAL